MDTIADQVTRAAKRAQERLGRGDSPTETADDLVADLDRIIATHRAEAVPVHDADPPDGEGWARRRG